MKRLITTIAFVAIAATSFSQTKTSIYSEGICDCVNQQMGLDKNYPGCFEKALKDHIVQFNQDLLEKGDTSKEGKEKLRSEIATTVMIDLIRTCPIFYNYFDSIEEASFRILNNKDPLKQLINGLDTVHESKRDEHYYKFKAILFFQSGDYDGALKMAEAILSKDSLNTDALFLKATVFDKKKRYAEAIELYEKIAAMTKNKGYLFFAAVDRRKLEGK